MFHSFQPDERNFKKACNESLLDGFTVRPVGVGQDIVYAGHIIGCRGELIFIKITQGFEEILSYYDQEAKFFALKFFTNRLVYQVLLNTLEYIKNHKLHAVLINNPKYEQVFHSNKLTANEQDFSCPFSATLNEEQKTALQHIVWGQNYDVPILLHGPPGTGKTRTVVASIAEVVRGSNDFVLVLAHSNLACVVSTLLTAGCLVRAREEDSEYDSGHFTRIFIDEAGCIHEPASMIPIAGWYLSGFKSG